ncbi:hypothetical protein BDZ90DRAFT_277553 [Jaminaea rosea]|uniref:Uncharacterized protein n=1 Tax=Jaminaea rosea TaxID=1569628 RepID=A0A316V0S6_9BASI|nr:hypothetical protein BDZ90DRAFT_277553 [Jaminaea rosea]PWN31157.1 hypothetical protein BDZ90DRAFT_277553 [Jaminaea rosea]
MPSGKKSRKRQYSAQAHAFASSTSTTRAFQLPPIPHKTKHTLNPDQAEMHEWDKYVEALQAETERAIGQRAAAAALFRQAHGYECPTRQEAAEQARLRAQAKAQAQEASARAKVKAQVQAQVAAQVHVAQQRFQAVQAAAAAASRRSALHPSQQRELLPAPSSALPRMGRREYEERRRRAEQEEQERLDRIRAWESRTRVSSNAAGPSGSGRTSAGGSGSHGNGRDSKSNSMPVDEDASSAKYLRGDRSSAA